MEQCLTQRTFAPVVGEQAWGRARLWRRQVGTGLGGSWHLGPFPALIPQSLILLLKAV